MLFYVLRLTTENDIEIIPSYGTLLGLIREQEIIRHDYDVDLYLFEEECRMAAIRGLSQKLNLKITRVCSDS